MAAALAAAGQPLLLPRGAAPSLPIVLGGAGQTMRGMMALYTALATNGVVDGRRLLTPEAAKTVAMVLTRAFPGGEQQGIAWKTGTSWGDRDNWAFGFDRDHVVGVWVGRPDGTAMDGGAAVDHALPILAQVFGLLPPAPLAGPESSPRMLSLAVVPDADPLRLLFPPPGAVIDGAGAIDLKAMGGTRPLRPPSPLCATRRGRRRGRVSIGCRFWTRTARWPPPLSVCATGREVCKIFRGR
jgi:penicillin-binding protein 1C